MEQDEARSPEAVRQLKANVTKWREHEARFRREGEDGAADLARRSWMEAERVLGVWGELGDKMVGRVLRHEAQRTVTPSACRLPRVLAPRRQCESSGRPRGRRERHVARATSSSDPPDGDGPSDPPPPRARLTFACLAPEQRGEASS